MSRPLSSALLAAIGGDGTEPGYFVEILFDTPLHLCSRGTIAWSGTTWTGWDMRVDGLDVDGAQSSQSGTLVLGNADLSIGALVLGEGVSERTINIWKFYGAAPDAADAVHVFAGVGDEAAIDPDAGVVQISLALAGGETLYAPRHYITPEQGFSILPAPGTVIPWGGENFVLRAEG